MNRLIARLNEIAEAAGISEKDEGRSALPPLNRFRVDHIRLSADTFVHALNGSMPTTERELLAVVWTFGRVLDGHLQKQIQLQMKLADDLLNAIPTIYLAVSRDMKEPK